MQDRTINNALIALRKQGGPQGAIAEGLLLMRGVPLPRILPYKQSSRRQTVWLVLDVLQDGPKTCPEICDLIQFPQDCPRRYALHRVYMALRRLEGRGRVRREGRVWLLF